jgi:hypothetical protein
MSSLRNKGPGIVFGTRLALFKLLRPEFVEVCKWCVEEVYARGEIIFCCKVDGAAAS